MGTDNPYRSPTPVEDNAPLSIEIRRFRWRHIPLGCMIVLGAWDTLHDLAIIFGVMHNPVFPPQKATFYLPISLTFMLGGIWGLNRPRVPVKVVILLTIAASLSYFLLTWLYVAMTRA